jgi:hypothetical protein
MTSRRSLIAGIATLLTIGAGGGSARATAPAPLTADALGRGGRYTLKEGIILYFLGADLGYLCAVSGLHGTSMCGPSDNLDYERAWWELYRDNQEFYDAVHRRAA